MAKRPALAGNDSARSEDEQVRDEVAARDAATVDEATRTEVLPSDGASDGAKAAGDADETAAAAKPEYEQDDARSAIIASYAKNRDKVIPEGLDGDAEEEAGEADDGLDDKAAAATDGAQTEEEKKAAADKVAADAAAKAKDDPIVKVKVDGVEIEMPLSEVTAIAQKNLAADNRLREANAILDRAKGAQNQNRTDDADRQADNAGDRTEAKPAERGGKTKLTPESVLGVVDSLQAGTPQEAAEQLAELLNSAQPDQAGQGDDPATVAREVILNDKAEADVTAAIEAAREKFPDLAANQDPRIGKLAVQEVLDQVAARLKAIGYTDAELAATPAEKMLTGYARLRRDPNFADGRKLAPISEIIDKVSAGVTETFIRPKPAPAAKPGQPQGRPTIVVDTAQRTARKVAASQQPRQASVRTDMTAVGQPGKRRDSSDVVNDMARARGQLAAG